MFTNKYKLLQKPDSGKNWIKQIKNEKAKLEQKRTEACYDFSNVIS